MADTTAVATRSTSALANMEPRFVEAFGAGKLDRLSAAEQSQFLGAFGQHIGVRSELGELMIYQGKPYITIAGRVRIAHGTGLLAGIQPRPATMLERRQFNASDDEVLWVCDVYRHGAQRAFRGWGVCNPTKDRNPVAKSFPREMAKKRAKYDALALAFPPDETLGPLHSAYIAAAEDAVRDSLAGKQIAAAQYDESDEVPEGLDGEAAPSDASPDDLPVDSEVVSDADVSDELAEALEYRTKKGTALRDLTDEELMKLRTWATDKGNGKLSGWCSLVLESRNSPAFHLDGEAA